MRQAASRASREPESRDRQSFRAEGQVAYSRVRPAPASDRAPLNDRARTNDRTNPNDRMGSSRFGFPERPPLFQQDGALTGGEPAVPVGPRRQRHNRPRLHRRLHALWRHAFPAYAPMHPHLTLLTLLMGLAAVFVVFSSSMALAVDHHQPPEFYAVKQAQALGVSLLSLVFFSRVRRSWLPTLCWMLYVGALVGLVLTLVPGLGIELGGVKRWLRVPGLPPLQVSEIMKLALAGVLARLWTRHLHKAGATATPTWACWAQIAFFTAVPAALVFLQPHLSATLLLVVLPLLLAFVAGVDGRALGTVVLALVVAGTLCVTMAATHTLPFLKPYQQDRIANFLPGHHQNARGDDFQVIQAGKALEAGGVLGVGLGRSYYKQGHLPAPHTDMILAVIGEELGLCGVVLFLACYLLLVLWCLQIAHQAVVPFEAVMCSGVGLLLAMQLVMNAAVVTGLLPVTGMPLPLLSYGGSGLLCSLMGIGMVLNVSRHTGRGRIAEPMD